MTEWIAMSWVRAADHEAMEVPRVEITRMNSPFYAGERFAVRKGSLCLARDGEWEYEPIPSSRDDEFYKRCRFDTFDAAKAAADAQQSNKEPTP